MTGRVRPTPPPPGAAFGSISEIAALLGVSVRRLGELRGDPAFPGGRLFGGAGCLRFSVPAILKWAEAQQEARFASIGGASRFQAKTRRRGCRS